MAISTSIPFKQSLSTTNFGNNRNQHMIYHSNNKTVCPINGWSANIIPCSCIAIDEICCKTLKVTFCWQRKVVLRSPAKTFVYTGRNLHSYLAKREKIIDQLGSGLWTQRDKLSVCSQVLRISREEFPAQSLELERARVEGRWIRSSFLPILLICDYSLQLKDIVVNIYHKQYHFCEIHM